MEPPPPAHVLKWTYSTDQQGRLRPMGIMKATLPWQQWLLAQKHNEPYFNSDSPIVRVRFLHEQDAIGPYKARIDVSTTGRGPCADTGAHEWAFWLLDVSIPDLIRKHLRQMALLHSGRWLIAPAACTPAGHTEADRPAAPARTQCANSR